MSGAERILGALRRHRGQPCSGEELSKDLGVSRAQVWKHVESLRARGYEIVGAPGGGYALVALPDRLYAEELQEGLGTSWLGRVIHHLETTDSTNRVAGELARDGAVHGTAVVAEHQSAGRGRLGRSFFSPAHQNLYVSFVLRPALPITQAATVILGAGLAVAQCVAESLDAPDRVAIKWPNDVQVDGLKVSGILMEMSAEATRIGHLVLGIGVNLNVPPESFPEDFRGRATSLRAAAGHRIDRVDFTRRLFFTLEAVLDRHAVGGFEALRGEFDGFYRMRGTPISVADLDGSERIGRAGGIGADGALELHREDGRLERVVAGDVTLRPHDGTAATERAS